MSEEIRARLVDGVDIHLPRHLSWAAVGAFIGVIAVSVAGYLTLLSQVEANTAAITALARETTESIQTLALQAETDRVFHVDQRVRLWDRIEDRQQLNDARFERILEMIQNVRETNANVMGRLSGIEASIARIADSLETRRPPN